MNVPPARHATVSTPPGPFTVVVTRHEGADVVLASGWTDDVADLLPVVHRSLRPTWVEQADDLPVLVPLDPHPGAPGRHAAVPVHRVR